MTRALVTLACGAFYEQMSALTHPTIQAYAERVGAEFIVWNEFRGHRMPHYRKLELGKLLNRFDRVLYVDTDILIRDDAPDIFALVPEDRLGMMNEGLYYDRKEAMMLLMANMHSDPAIWDGSYWNTGVMVLSQIHRELFVQPAFEWDNFKEQTYLNCLIAETRTQIFPLPHRFNRVYGMDEHHHEVRFDAYFLHYAGMDDILSEPERLDLIRHDLGVWNASRPDYVFPPLNQGAKQSP